MQGRPLMMGHPCFLFLIQDFSNSVDRQTVRIGEFFHRNALPVRLTDFLIPPLQFLPVAGHFSPWFGMRRVGGDIQIAPLDIGLQFPNQRRGKKRVCVDILHVGFLLAVIQSGKASPI